MFDPFDSDCNCEEDDADTSHCDCDEKSDPVTSKWERRAKFGTAAWLAVALAMAFFSDKNFFELDLNAKGDFLAGVFAPLAFLWLIVSYRQQSEELNQTRKEMSRQASALEESQIQQRKMARVATDTYELDVQERARRNSLDKWRMQPVFRVDHSEIQYSDSGGSHVAIFAFANMGAECRDVWANLTIEGIGKFQSEGPSRHNPVSLVATGDGRSPSNATVRFKFFLPELRAHEKNFIIVEVHYLDQLRESESVTLLFSAIPKNRMKYESQRHSVDSFSNGSEQSLKNI